MRDSRALSIFGLLLAISVWPAFFYWFGFFGDVSPETAEEYPDWVDWAPAFLFIYGLGALVVSSWVSGDTSERLKLASRVTVSLNFVFLIAMAAFSFWLDA